MQKQRIFWMEFHLNNFNFKKNLDLIDVYQYYTP
jgi:hypothetical protein